MTLAVKDATGATQNIPFPNGNGQATGANSAPVVIASDQSALAVTGSFWPSTQPVSGTFWPATQPVTLAALPPLPAGSNVLGTVLGPLPAAPITGQQVLTTSAAPLPANALENGITLTALATNSGTVFVGASGVTAGTGYPLAAGQSFSFAVANASGISILGSVAGDKIAFAGN